MLSQDGIMRFINIQTCKLLFEIGSLDDGISSSVISPHGRYIASIMENGSLNIYSVQTLTKEINKVCYQVNFPFFFKDLNVVSSKIKALLQFFNFLAPLSLFLDMFSRSYSQSHISRLCSPMLHS